MRDSRRNDYPAVLKKGLRQNGLFFMGAEGLLAAVALLCYNNIFWMLPMQPLLVPAFRMFKKKQGERRRRQYLKGFREVLQSLMTSLQAGYSLENACRAALEELEGIYPSQKNPTIYQLRKIVRGIELHTAPEQLFMAYAEDTGMEEIYEFAMVLSIVRGTGGNVVDVLKNAMEHLQLRMDAAEELQVTLSGRIFEKNIMLMMPFGVLLYLRLANPDYVEGLYSTWQGNCLMSVVIVSVLCSYFWTEKIMKIEF